MGSVNPCDSASNGGGECTGLHATSVQSPSFILEMFKGVTSPSLVTTMTPVALKVCDLYSSYLQTVATVSVRDVPAQSCSGTPSAVSCSSAGSVASTSSVSVGSSATVGRSKWRSAQRAKAWRALNVPKSFPPGFCYSRVFRSRARECVATELGSWPTVQALLAQPEEFGQHPCMLDDYRLAVLGGDRYHLVCPSDSTDLPTVSLVDALVGFARRHEFGVGTYGHMLKGVRRVGCSQEVVDLLTARAVVGGDARDPGYVRGLLQQRETTLESLAMLRERRNMVEEELLRREKELAQTCGPPPAYDETCKWEPATEEINVRVPVQEEGHLVRLPESFVIWPSDPPGDACSRAESRLCGFPGLGCVGVYKSVDGTVLAHLLCKASAASGLAAAAGGEYLDEYGVPGQECVRDKSFSYASEESVFDYFSVVEGKTSCVSLINLLGAAGFMKQHDVFELMGPGESSVKGLLRVYGS